MRHSAMDEKWTILRLLQWTEDYLRQHNAESPRLEAEVLLAEARSCQRIELYTAFDEEADEPTRLTFRELVRRRADGMPVAYLVGRKEFYSMSFRVTPEVLIPRPETEHIVVALLDLVKEYTRPEPTLQVLDVGTGSGILAVCAAMHVKNCQVTAVDISNEALEIARKNAAAHQVEERIAFVESDLLAALPAEQTFDFIVSNPPYVSESEYAELPTDVREHEPRGALVGGPTGAEVIARLIDQAAPRLRQGGALLIEISPMIHESVKKLVEARDDLRLESTIKDLAGHYRVVQANK
ncbi:MAG: peptide chain release factor N(5)-glutamine methyltransferase [Pirellulales bacterium]